MIDSHAKIFADFKSAHAKLYLALKQMHDAVYATADQLELADMAYTVNELSKFAADSKKEAEEVKALISQKLCLLWMKVGTGEPVRTEYCTITPNITMAANIPSRKNDTEKYHELMDFLGVPQELSRPQVCEEGKPVVETNFNGIMQYISNQLAIGGELPPGIDMAKTFPVYKLTIRAKKEVDSKLDLPMNDDDFEYF